MADTIIIYEGSIGDVGGTASPQFVAPAALAPGTPLMLDAAGLLVAADGTKPIVGYSPYASVLPGQSYTPQGMNVAKVDPAAPYTLGSDYYLQANGTLGTTITSRYAGTAVSTTTLVVVPTVAAQSAALGLVPDTAITDQGPASNTNSLLTESSFTALGTVVPGTFTNAGVTGTISYRIKPHGVNIECFITGYTIGDGTIFAQLPTPPTGASYMTTEGLISDGSGRVAGLYHAMNTGIYIVRSAGVVAPIAFLAFVNYA
jgi:hypothetical protein